MSIGVTTLHDVSDDLSLALRLADAADALTMQRFGALDLRVETKPDLTPVSDADRATEELLRDLIASERPDDTIMGEEFGETGTAERCWVVDPIDGTKNYIRGVPVWATLIALTTTWPVTNQFVDHVGCCQRARARPSVVGVAWSRSLADRRRRTTKAWGVCRQAAG